MDGDDADDTVLMSVIAVLTITLTCAALFLPLLASLTAWSVP
jgi:hypothetical protein